MQKPSLMNVKCTEGTAKANKVGEYFLQSIKTSLVTKLKNSILAMIVKLYGQNSKLKAVKHCIYHLFITLKLLTKKSLKNVNISVRRASQIKNAALFIGGDFILPGWDWKNRILKPNAVHPKNHYAFGNTLDDTSLVQLTEQPTRQDNTLDLMITNLPNDVQKLSQASQIMTLCLLN